MELNDLETLPNLKSQKGKSVTSRVSSWTPKSPIDGEATADAYWNYAQRNSRSIPRYRNKRKQEYTIMDPTISSYSSSSSYNQQNHRVLPNTTHLTFSQIQNSDQGFRCDQASTRSIRNKLLTNNVAVVRKDQYKEELEDEANYKYDEDELLLNSVDENLEDEAGEEEEYQDETYNFHEKDYEEQDIDDEVDIDDADAFSRLHRMQKSAQNDHQLRTQQLRAVEHQQEARQIQHQQRIQKLQQSRTMERCYHAGVRNDPISHDTSYGDVSNVISEEEVNVPSATSRKSSIGSSRTLTYQPMWNQLRKSTDRGKTVLRPSSPPEKNHRRSCRMRSDLESLMEPQLMETHLKKCCMCRGSVNIASEKSEFCRKGIYRLQNSNGGFFMKGPIGHDGESEELNVCGLCPTRHHLEDLRTVCKVSAPFYLTKHRRSKYPRSPIYETTEEEGQVIDEISNIYSSVPQRHSREVPREKTRHSVQSTRASSRKTSRF